MALISWPFSWGKKAGREPASAVSMPQMSAATTLPPQAPPKSVKAGQITLPSYLKTAKPSTGAPLAEADRRLANTDITTLRNGVTSHQVIEDFVRASPDLSAAVAAQVRVAITSTYTAIAYNPDGTVNPDATSLLAQIITRLNIINDYTIGYDDSPSIRSLSETWAREILKTGAMSGELVLDKSRLPYKIQPISTSQVRMFPSTDGKKLVPKQKIPGGYIDLDIPTFFMVSLDQDTTTPYPVSPIEPAIQAVIASAEFMNDVRKIIKRAIHPRVVVTIDEEKFTESMPLEARHDQAQASQWLNDRLADIQREINGLEPEEALVLFSSIGFEVKDHGNTNLSNEYEVIQKTFDSKMAAGTKVLPTVLGHSDGTSNTASAEVLLFMKYVDGSVRTKLNEMFSKILTLAVRLFGQDVYVEFAYEDIDLRPSNEIEAFRAMKQSRVLEQLSLGLISDEAASIMLTGRLPPAGYTPKSGTGFRAGTSLQPAGDGYNGASNSGSTMNQNLNSNAPKNAKSANGGKPGN
jgi:hypothetical protein